MGSEMCIRDSHRVGPAAACAHRLAAARLYRHPARSVSAERAGRHHRRVAGVPRYRSARSARVRCSFLGIPPPHRCTGARRPTRRLIPPLMPPHRRKTARSATRTVRVRFSGRFPSPRRHAFFAPLKYFSQNGSKTFDFSRAFVYNGKAFTRYPFPRLAKIPS